MMKESYHEIIAFIAVAREKSFTKAAAHLGVSQSALSHSMRTLENKLGIRLLTRTTRNVSTTEAGERILQNVAPRFEEIDHELESLTTLTNTPSGTVRISCSDHAADTVIWPKIGPLIKDNPNLKIEILTDNGLTNIVSERIDAGVRLGEALDLDMIGVKIGPELRLAVIAAPDFLDKNGVPENPEDLLNFPCVNMRFVSSGSLYEWEFENDEKETKVKVNGQLAFNSVHLIKQAVLDGFGLGFIPEDMCEKEFANGTLVRVMESWCKPYPGYHLYYPNRQFHSAAFRAVVDALKC